MPPRTVLSSFSPIPRRKAATSSGGMFPRSWRVREIASSEGLGKVRIGYLEKA